MSPSLAVGTLPGRKTKTTPETLDKAFRQALDNFYDLQSEIGFIELCQEHGIDIKDRRHPQYWSNLADYAAIRSEEDELNGLPERVTVLNELVASAPDYVFKQEFLDQHGHDHHDAHQAKEVASYFNGLIRLAAENWPDLSVASLSSNLYAACRAINNPHVRANAQQQLLSAIRGAQHEVIFGQLLEHTDRDFHQTSIRQDLKGVDYTVTSPSGHEQYIDVKTSMHDIYKYGGSQEKPYAIAAGNHLIMFSLVHDYELNGSFFIPEELAAERGNQLQHILDELLYRGQPHSHKRWYRHNR